MYNNQALQLFLMTTVEPFRLCWPTGVENMLLVSIGTGTSPAARNGLCPDEMHLLFNAGSIPSALMFAALQDVQQLDSVDYVLELQQVGVAVAHRRVDVGYNRWEGFNYFGIGF